MSGGNLFARNHKEFLMKEYVDNERSTYDLAKELGAYPNKISRALKALGVPMRDKSSAQSAALSSGRHKHPTKGKKRSEATKIKISDGMHTYWKEMDSEERERRVEMAKQQWQEMSLQERDLLRKMAAEAVRKASKEGSKMENFLRKGLTDSGYNVIFHKRGLVLDDKLEVDLFIPELKTAIEIDGPAHFLPIWGEENLQKHIVADARKSGLLINRGFVVVRIKHIVKNVSEKHKRDMLTKTVECLKSIEKNFPPVENRLLEIEI